MAKKYIVFVCFDEEYISTIEYKFAQLVGQKADIEFISDIGIFTEFIGSPRKVDIMILPAGLNIQIPDFYGNTKIYYMTDTETDMEAPQYIYKYYSVKTIVDKMDSEFLIDDAATDSKGTKVIGVFSVSGGCGKTITALSLAYNLRKKGNKVCYISTVTHQDFRYYLESNYVLSSTFCYQCSINIKNALKTVPDEIKNEFFDYLPPFKNLPVSYQIKFDSYVQIIDLLKRKNTYDYIVVELSSELQPQKLAFFKSCYRCVFITTQDKASVKKLETFLSSMLDFNKNIVLLCNRYNKSHNDYLSDSPLLGNCEFCEYIEEYYGTIEWESIKNTNLFDKITLCIE